MARILGLDIGQSRIGAAISDETQTIARGLETIGVSRGQEPIGRIRDIVTGYKIEKVVVGLPLKMDGEKGPAAEKILNFVDRLKESLPVEVSTFDERLTTKQGEVVLLQADLSRKKRKSRIDKMAAQIILQTYLDLKKQRRT